MSTSLRDKAREVKAAGESERGNFQPSGAPLRVFNWWLRTSPSDKAREIRSGERKENFCHFWRVVAIWAPLMFLLIKAEDFFTHPATVIAMGVAAVVAVIYLSLAYNSFALALGFILAGILATAVAIYGVVSGVALTYETDQQRISRGWPEKRWAVPGAVVGFPFALISFTFVKVKEAWNQTWTNVWLGVMAFIGVVTVFGLLTSIVVTEGFMTLLIALGIIILAGIGLLAFALAFSALADFINGRRKLARENRRKQEEEYYDKNGHFPDDEPREPGFVERFFLTLGDYIVFMAQVVRVKKWKICPIVEVDTNKAA